MASVTMRQMLEAGVHFGHQTRRWNPRMRPFIFTERHGIHILDLAKTVPALDVALQQVRAVASSGQQVLFVGTKKQAREVLRQEADRCGMPYINTRWLGGTLSNWTTISRRIAYYKDLEARAMLGEDPRMTKKERLLLQKEFERMQRSFGGLKNMERLPGMVFIVDPTMEAIAVEEANSMRMPIVAMCDTDANPDKVNFPIPANDDAIRSIQLIAGRIADAVLEGMAYGEVEQQAAREAVTTDAPPPSSRASRVASAGRGDTASTPARPPDRAPLAEETDRGHR